MNSVKLRYWIVILVLGVLLVIFLPLSIDSYSKRDSIRRATSIDFLQTVSSTLSPTNTHFTTSDLSIKDVRYLSDSVALVKIFNNTDEVGGYLVFELQDNTLSLTNYSGSFFTASDFGVDSTVVGQVISTASEM